MNVLVTGCAGYIGSVLVNHISNYLDWTIYGLDNFRYKQYEVLSGLLQNSNFHLIKEDVRNVASYKKILHRCDAVVHLAALVGAPICAKHSLEAQSVNADATKAIAKELSQNQFMIYPNTNSGYGIKADGQPCTEDSPLEPISLYGTSKCEGEKAVANRNKGVSLRLATVFGLSFRPRFDLMVNNFVARLVEYNRLTIFEPHFKRNFVHIQDVIRGILFFFWYNNSGVFNFGNDTLNMTKMDLAWQICDILGEPRGRVDIGEGIDPDRRDYIVSNKKILDLGFQFNYGLKIAVPSLAEYIKYIGDEFQVMGNYS